MILDKEVKIKNNGRISGYYNSIGIDTNNDFITVPIYLITKGPHVIINCLCDICNKNIKMMYKTYISQTKYDGLCYCEKCSIIKKKKVIKEKYGVENYTETEEFKNKTKTQCLNKYGTEFYQSSDEYKSKIKTTCMKKYGVENYAQTKECQLKMKSTRIENKNQISDELKNPFELYRLKTISLTRAIKNQLFESWDGYDYYDNEYIKDNFKYKPSDRLYPTIDHKISVYYGYINSIPPEEICKIENLCITKKYINSSKRFKNEYL